jgi:hypothetical protein
LHPFSFLFFRPPFPPLGRSYGFCLHPNPADGFAVALAAAGGGLAQGARRFALRAARLTRRAHLSRHAPLPPSLLAALRICLASDGEVYAAGSAAERGAKSESKSSADGDASSSSSSLGARPGCARTEARVVCTLRRALRDALRAVAVDGDADAAVLAPASQGGIGIGTVCVCDGIRGSDAPAWALAAYRTGQADILRAALHALAEHAAAALLPAETEAEAETTAHADGAAMEEDGDGAAFVDWLSRGGAVTPGFTRASLAALGARRAGRGWAPPPLVLAADVAAGAVLARLPASLLLRADDVAAVAASAAAAAASDAGAAAAAAVSGDEEEALSFALAWHRSVGDASPFAAMLAPMADAPPPLAAAAVLAPLLEGTTAGAAAAAEQYAAEHGDDDDNDDDDDDADADAEDDDGDEGGGRGASVDALCLLLQAAGVRDAGAAAAWGRAAAARACVGVVACDGSPRPSCLVPVAHALAVGPLWGALVEAQAAPDGSGDVLLVRAHTHTRTHASVSLCTRMGMRSVTFTFTPVRLLRRRCAAARRCARLPAPRTPPRCCLQTAHPKRWAQAHLHPLPRPRVATRMSCAWRRRRATRSARARARCCRRWRWTARTTWRRRRRPRRYDACARGASWLYSRVMLTRSLFFFSFFLFGPRRSVAWWRRYRCACATWTRTPRCAAPPATRWMPRRRWTRRRRRRTRRTAPTSTSPRRSARR